MVHRLIVCRADSPDMDTKIKERLDRLMGAVTTGRLVDLSVLKMLLYDQPEESLGAELQEWANQYGYQVDWIESIESYFVRNPGNEATCDPSFSRASRALKRRSPRVVLGLMLICV